MNSNSQTGSPNSKIIPFQPHNENEQTTAEVVRMMLQYEVSRVQLENTFFDISEADRLTLRQEAIATRLNGFRTQREAIARGLKVSYDDELLQIEGTKIAYLLARGATEEAKLLEEEVVTLSVSTSLYDIDADYLHRSVAA